MGAFRFIAIASLLLGGCSGGLKQECKSPGCTAGSPCKVTRDCAVDAGFSCSNGVCSQKCDASKACPAGQVCGEVKGQLQCFAACADGKCAAGAGCQTEWTTRTEVCAGAVFPKACKSVENTSGCSASNPQFFTTDCHDGYVCPSNGDCDLFSSQNGTCFCASGFETTRSDGVPCITPQGDQICQPPDYYCKPLNLPGTTCLTEPMGGAGNCHCADGRTLPFVCGETSSCEHRCSLGCDVLKQDCPDAKAPKCSAVYERSVVTLIDPGDSKPQIDRLSCGPLFGTKKLGETCQLVPFPDGGVELMRDDCDKGLACEGSGLPRGEQRCRKLCTGKADCPTGEGCLYRATTFPPLGVCLATGGCTYRGTECPAGQSCSPASSTEQDPLLYCKYDGPMQVGESCADAGCVADVVCRGGKCLATCSPSVPCATGTCEPLGFYRGGLGVCY